MLLTAPALAGKPFDRTTVLPTYVLPEAAAADGKLDEWAGIPPVPAESFKLNLANETTTGSADFAPSLRCGMKNGSGDLFFLVLVLDSQLRAEESFNNLSGDCLELYLDFGREERDRTIPDWHKAPYSNAYWPRIEPVRSLGQFVIRPPTVMGPANTFKSPNAEHWKLDVACTRVEGGVAYELRLDAASVLADLQMAELPAVVGIDVGFIDQDYAPRLHAENWANDDGLYRLFGDWTSDAVSTRYGMLSTRPEAGVAVQSADRLPRPLAELFGEFPTADDVRKALGRTTVVRPYTANTDRLAMLVEWAGMQGLAFEPELVRQIMKIDSAAAREACLAVLAFAEQEPDAVRAGVDAAYGEGATPHVLSIANLLSQRLAIGPAVRLRPLLTDEELTVAFTAAAAVAAVGEAADAVWLGAACDGHCARLKTAPPIRDTGYHHWYAGKAQRASAVRYFFGTARETLLGRTERIEVPKFTPARTVQAANTDLERFIPIDGNNVYNAAGLLRGWQKDGPRELWRVTVGQGKSGVVEAGGRAFTAALGDGRQWGVCLEAATGKTLWRVPLDGEGAKATEIIATPVIDGDRSGRSDRVYFVPAQIGQEDGLTVVCLKTANGSEVWRGSDELEHVASCPTPLIVGDLLYCPLLGRGGPQSPAPVLVAVDKLTGSIRWRSPAGKAAPGRKSGAGIASPTYQIIDGIPQVIVSAYTSPVNAVWGVHALTGELLWEYGANAHYAMIPSAVAYESRVFLCDGLPPFSACLQMHVRNGRIKARQVYHDGRNQCNQYNTPAIVDGCVYGFSNGAMQCTRLSEGKLLWKRDDRDWANGPQLIVADGLIFALGTRQLVLAEASPGGYRELGRVPHRVVLGYPQQPTIANGRLYVRGDTEVVCWEVRR